MRLLRPDGGMDAGVHRTNQRKVHRQVGLQALQRSRQRRDRQKNRGEKTDQHRQNSGFLEKRIWREEEWRRICGFLVGRKKFLDFCIILFLIININSRFKKLNKFSNATCDADIVI
ncbi:hypothetical protein LINGRAHAP2_LOCUS3486 [Linum grandiflorum]